MADKYSLPDLPYDYSALEPHIDAKTMEIHHTKHHQTYVDKLNAAIEGTSSRLVYDNVDDLMRNFSRFPPTSRARSATTVAATPTTRCSGRIMGPDGGGEPLRRRSPISARRRRFGSFKEFQDKFSAAATNHFGSGWAWLVLDGRQARRHQPAQPGLAADGRPDPDPRASTCGSTPTTSSTRTRGPTTSRPGGTSSTGTPSRSASTHRVSSFFVHFLAQNWHLWRKERTEMKKGAGNPAPSTS